MPMERSRYPKDWAGWDGRRKTMGEADAGGIVGPGCADADDCMAMEACERSECRNHPNCLLIYEYGARCDGREREGGDGTAPAGCSDYEPMPDASALRSLAEELDGPYRALEGLLATGSEFKYAMGASGAMGAAMEQHDIAVRIRSALGEGTE